MLSFVAAILLSLGGIIGISLSVFLIIPRRADTDLKSGLNQLSEQVQHRFEEVEARMLRLEGQADLLSLSAIELKHENLRSYLRLGGVEPIYSSRLVEKARRVDGYLKDGKKVALIGEAMVGKTTLLYTVVSDLLMGSKRVYTQGLNGMSPDGVYVHYSSVLGEKMLSVLSQHQGPVLMEARTEAWNELEGKVKEAQGFIVVEVERDDNEGVLGDILRAKLKHRNEIKSKGGFIP
jgi:ATPase subunit of ABC transporter with duplicated ATPase domains